MALLLNGKNIYTNPGTFTGSFTNESGNWIKGGLRNRFAGGLSSRFSAYPNGHLHPGAFVLPLKAGSISSYTLSKSAITSGAPVLIEGQPITLNANGSITVTASQLDQIVSAIVNASGALSVTTASASAAANITANANGTLTLTSAQLGAVISTILNASGSLSPNVNMSALGFISANIGGPTPLSPEGLAQAVWNALIADFQEAGSTGEALFQASNPDFNPWDELLTSNNTAGTFGRRVQELLTKNQFLGLK